MLLTPIVGQLRLRTRLTGTESFFIFVLQPVHFLFTLLVDLIHSDSWYQQSSHSGRRSSRDRSVHQAGWTCAHVDGNGGVLCPCICRGVGSYPLHTLRECWSESYCYSHGAKEQACKGRNYRRNKRQEGKIRETLFKCSNVYFVDRFYSTTVTYRSLLFLLYFVQLQ